MRGHLEHPTGVGAQRGGTVGREGHTLVVLGKHTLGGDCGRSVHQAARASGSHCTDSVALCLPNLVALAFAFHVISAPLLTQSPKLAAVHHPQDTALLGALA